MCDVTVRTRGVELSSDAKVRIEAKAADACKVFDVRGLICDVLLEQSQSRNKAHKFSCSVTITFPKQSLHTTALDKSAEDAAILALDKASRRLRRHKTRVCDRYENPQSVRERAQMRDANVTDDTDDEEEYGDIPSAID